MKKYLKKVWIIGLKVVVLFRNSEFNATKSVTVVKFGDKAKEVLRIIRLVREGKGIGQKEIAEYLGIKRSHYSMIESGKREIGLERMLAVLDKLGLEFQINHKIKG